jgi:hypothetical protein
LLRKGAPMSEEREIIQYAEEVDEELAQLRVAVWDLVDLLDANGMVVDLEAGHSGDGPVIRLCRMTGKPIPPRLKAWLAKSNST